MVQIEVELGCLVLVVLFMSRFYLIELYMDCVMVLRWIVVSWIDPRYHNPEAIGIVSYRGVVEDQRKLRNGKGRNYPFCGEPDKDFS